MSNNSVPDYLSDLVPVTVGNATRYNLRRSQDIQNIHCRTTLYQSSFLPSVIRDWNSLSDETRQSPSVSAFKNSIFRKQHIPRHFYHGDRKSQVYLSRLRTNCSSLNYDLYSKNMTDSPLCTCGLVENTTHYFLQCNRYIAPRAVLFQRILPFSDVSLPVLLNGDQALTDAQNTQVVDAVYEYIRATKRF